MRKRNLLRALFLIPFIFFCSCSPKMEYKGEFGFLPEKPQRGSELTILYKPAKPAFEQNEEFYAKVYVFEKDLKLAADVKMSYSEGGWVGKMTLPNSGYGALLVFENDENRDDNKGLGYLIKFSDNSGKQYDGFPAAYAQALFGWGRSYLGLAPELEDVAKMFDAAVAADSSVLKEYGNSLSSLHRRLNPENFEKKRADIHSYIERNFTATEREIEFLYGSFMQLKNTQKADEYRKMMEEKFPQAELLQTLMMGRMRTAKEISEKLKVADNFNETFPSSQKTIEINSSVITEYRNAKQFNEAISYAKKHSEKVSLYSIFSLLYRMEQEGADPALAQQALQLGSEIYNKRIADPLKYKSPEETPKYYTDILTYYYGMMKYVSAKFYDKQGDIKSALDAMAEAYTLTKGNDPSIYEFFAELLIKSGDFNQALEKTSAFIVSGKASNRIKEIYKESVIKTIGSEIAAEDGLAELEAAAKEKMKNKLLKSMVTQPSPDFTLVNLDGRKVALSDLKGKIVIIDFWATWCGPCINSFPGMQMAVNKFKDDPDVEFLFINTWENVENKEENARKFIQDKKYTFNVLMDLDNKVITSYKVRGIPTKFILDKEGKTRFVSVGYNGNNDELVEELSLMISVLKN